MSTWTSSAAFALAMLVAGCALVPREAAAPLPAAAPPAVAVVTGGAVRVSGPPGFCVDEGATRDDGETAFVLLAGCAAIAGDGDLPAPVVPAVLTASISAPTGEGSLAGAIPGLDAFFRSEDGRRLLSRDGDPDTVEILDSFHQGGVFFLQARDRSAGVVPGLAPDYWRAYLDLGPRIATLSALGRADAPIPDEAALALLRDFISRLRDPQGIVATAPAPSGPGGDGTLWHIGVIRRILG